MGRTAARPTAGEPGFSRESIVAVFSNFIGGEQVAGTQAVRNINPSNTDDVVGEFASGSAVDVAKAVAAAKAAFPAWSRTTPQERYDILKKASDEVLARKEELGRILSREEGKILAEGIGEAARAGQILAFFAGECLRLGGETIPSVRPGVGVEMTREPIGIVALITPWNFPIAIPAWKIAPALAYGNCVVIKPAEIVPHSTWALVDILQRAGLPKGVLNLVMGKGSVVGQAMLENPDVAALSFTGSVATGRKLAAACVAANPMKKFQLEMGGKNPLVVLDDADVDVAVASALNGAFFSTGQRCTASSRLIVTEKIHNRFVDALTEKMKALVVDDALKAGSQIGPVVDQSQMDQDERYLEIGRKEGAKLHWGGERLNRGTPGFYLQPALFTEATNSMRIAREEIFGPVASVIRVKDYDEALAIANDTEFGLSAGICTTSLKHAAHFKRNSEAGMVMVNLPTAGVDYHVPFGGRKASSYGPREQGAYAREFYTTVKTSYTLAG
jgi:acyl-CoA reductase-like NAD-dependent aldehyde dehydrogenase